MRLLLVLVLLLSITGCRFPCYDEITTSVVTLGGCDRAGNCGIITESGHKSIAYLPVVGGAVTIYVEKPCKEGGK